MDMENGPRRWTQKGTDDGHERRTWKMDTVEEEQGDWTLGMDMEEGHSGSTAEVDVIDTE